MQEINDFLQGFLGLVLTCNIPEGNAGLLFHIHLGLAFAKAAHHALAAHTLGEASHDKEDQGEHDHVVKNHDDAGVILHDHLIYLNAHAVQFLRQGHYIAVGKTGEAGLLLSGGLGGLVLGQVVHPVVVKLHFLQLACIHGIQKIGVGDFRILAVADSVID